MNELLKNYSKEIKLIMSKYPEGEEKSAVMPLIYLAQRNDSYVTKDELADIADRYRIKMFSCCGDYLIGPKIGKAHCISGEIAEELFYKNGFEHREKATRKECGCTDSTDIGTYDTCPNGCIYCYANVDKIKAYKRFEKHDEKASFLGYSKAESDKWIEVMKSRGNKRGGTQKHRIDKFQSKLF